MSSETQADGTGPEGATPGDRPDHAPTGEQADQLADQLSWWHRGHPVFTPLSGFFTGLLVVCLVPAAFAAVLGLVFDYDTAAELFPLVLVILAVPLGLVASARTRTFGRYMLAGMLLTALVVGGVAALAVWLMVTLDG